MSGASWVACDVITSHWLTVTVLVLRVTPI
jgi:hypothetical protein